MQACPLAALPSRAFLPPCERDARVPSTRDAGNAGVPPACQPREKKPTPLRNLKEGVLVYPYFCELWLGDWYDTNRLGKAYKNKRN